MEAAFSEKILMRIFIGEKDRNGRVPLYEALVEMLRQEGVAGATVIRGIAGFGASSVYHTDKLLELSHDLPIIIEVVDSREKLESLVPMIESIMSGGRITIERISVRDIAVKER